MVWTYSVGGYVGLDEVRERGAEGEGRRRKEGRRERESQVPTLCVHVNVSHIIQCNQCAMYMYMYCEYRVSAVSVYILSKVHTQ